MSFDDGTKREDGVQVAAKDADAGVVAASSPHEGVPDPGLDEAAGDGGSQGEATALAESALDGAVGDGDCQEGAIAGESSPASARKSGVLPLAVLLIVFLCGAVGGAGYLLWQKSGTDHITSQEVAAADAGESAQEETPKVKNPIDFDALQKENPEIYAWLSIPGTKVDTAVLQSATDDNYYLNHNER
ncbi:MAG: hypothetical protein ACI4B9_03595, partial [Eggerthellaceae bacterium]